MYWKHLFLKQTILYEVVMLISSSFSPLFWSLKNSHFLSSFYFHSLCFSSTNLLNVLVYLQIFLWGLGVIRPARENFSALKYSLRFLSLWYSLYSRLILFIPHYQLESDWFCLIFAILYLIRDVPEIVGFKSIYYASSRLCTVIQVLVGYNNIILTYHYIIAYYIVKIFFSNLCIIIGLFLTLSSCRTIHIFYSCYSNCFVIVIFNNISRVERFL